MGSFSETYNDPRQLFSQVKRLHLPSFLVNIRQHLSHYLSISNQHLLPLENNLNFIGFCFSRYR